MEFRRWAEWWRSPHTRRAILSHLRRGGGLGGGNSVSPGRSDQLEETSPTGQEEINRETEAGAPVTNQIQERRGLLLSLQRVRLVQLSKLRKTDRDEMSSLYRLLYPDELSDPSKPQQLWNSQMQHWYNTSFPGWGWSLPDPAGQDVRFLLATHRSQKSDLNITLWFMMI